MLQGARALGDERGCGALERLGSTLAMRRVRLASSSEVEGPVVVGVARRVLVLPEWFVVRSNEDELSSAIWHEIAHVDRHDFLMNLIYELLLLPIAFHPAAIFIKGQVERSRELACDEFAAHNLPTPTVYARSLLSIARSMQATASFASSGCAVGMFATNALEERIASLLQGKERSRGASALVRALGAAALLTMVTAIPAAFSLQVVHASDRASSLSPFVGVWEAQFEGATFATLTLSERDGKLCGTLSRSRIEIGDGGELTSAEARPGSDPIVPAAPQDRVLPLLVREDHVVVPGGGHSADDLRFEMRLVGSGAAELQVVGSPPGMPSPAPWKLKRKSEVAPTCSDGPSVTS
jgi:hypothetical protein